MNNISYNQKAHLEFGGANSTKYIINPGVVSGLVQLDHFIDLEHNCGKEDGLIQILFDFRGADQGGYLVFLKF